MPSSYALGGHFESLMDELIASGRYNSKSEIIRDGLRLLEDREALRQARLEALRAAIAEGADSGPGVDADAVFDRLEAKYQAMAQGAAE
ncbi:addiction module antidote protein, CC2985 family [Glycocaulis alkaliphilus]|uniref:Addiction module antidote protein, CC2985 family n=1 Tax=Glycocaulis alkaliphilus TaxID=1434191 RepID=A0A3T0EBZ6_9PROT|nr:type II toxin-antitoxin system ParD family antitoxin [Glycocaulis alkaliphilus]AZU04807.1 addiction module antidote protein, CC2985 family [Glycocaulis alkaliphilus]GGB67521.1 addiction module antitoxin [Glycocaulis alkaliphilus]